MPGIENTIARLSRFRRAFGRHENNFGGRVGATAASGPSQLHEILGFGTNPGNLRLHLHMPTYLAPRTALMVALHGCTQTAAQFEYGTGWSELADQHGFVVIYPEQMPANNPNRCFSWFQADDTARESGEALSIRQMIEHTVLAYGIDRRRVFVSGLSAGGAMTAAMLAAYPDVFAGGAIIAGLASGAATNLQQALERMAQGEPERPAALGNRVRAASPHTGPWPKVSVWHGSADATVHPANAEAIVAQWLDVHGLVAEPPREQVLDGFPRRVWTNAGGAPVVETVSITGMGHGVPLAADGTADRTGNSGPYLLGAGISAVDHIAAFFDLTDARVPARKVASRKATAPVAEPTSPQAIIEAALKAAGLTPRG